jgi:HlyD family secretion protein
MTGAAMEPKTGAPLYLARTSLPAKELTRLGGFKLILGMPVEAFVKADRTVMSCLIKPLSDQIAKAFRKR